MLHGGQIRGHRAAHMVIHAGGIRHPGNRGFNQGINFCGTHGRAQSIALQRLFADRCHRHMDKNFTALAVCFFCHFFAERGIRQDSNGDLRRQFQDAVIILFAVTEIIDHNGELRRSGRKRYQ